MKKRTFELVEGSSSKFWHIEGEGNAHTVHYGRIGTAGQTRTKEFADAAEACKSYDKLIVQKLRKGYVETGTGGTAKAPAKTDSKAGKKKSQVGPEAKTAKPAAPTSTDLRITRRLNLDPVDWLWATWRNPTPFEAPPPAKFDRKDCLRRLRRSADYSWDVIYDKARIAPVMSGEEAHFWFEAIYCPHGGIPLMPFGEMEFTGEVTRKRIRQRLANSCACTTVRLLVPLVNLIGRVVATETLFSRPEPGDPLLHAHPRPHEVTEWLLNAYRRFVLPYLSREERRRLRDLIRPKLDPATITGDPHLPFPAPYYLAAMLGFHDEVADVVHSWADDRYAEELARTDRYQLPQQLVFGLGDPADVEAQMRRLKLPLGRTYYIRAWLAHTETAALDYVFDSILKERYREKATKLIETLALVDAPEAAEHMLALKLQAEAKRPARQWLDAHPANAIAGLVPVAGGSEALADAAVDFLRIKKQQGHLDFIKKCRKAAGGEAAARVGHEVVNYEVRTYEPFDKGSTPAWLGEATAAAGSITCLALPQWVDAETLPALIVGGRRLSAGQGDALFAALRTSEPGEPHPLLAGLKQHAELESREAFAWALFRRWMDEEAPAKEKWALRAIGFLGGDCCAVKLTPMVRAWPGEASHARAVIGLECLRDIGTDTALIQLNGIARNLSFKGLKKKAGELIEEIARERGLTGPELEDRIVPDCDLDERGSRTFDFGPRRFHFVLGPGMKPMVRDEGGKLRTDLPKPRVTDDRESAEEAVAQWKRLKKQLREVVKIQGTRMEQAMITGRRWSVRDFDRFLVKHPLLTHLARLVVWGGYDEKGRPTGTFRMTEEQDFAGAGDEPCELAGVAEVGIVHPLHLTAEDRGAWSEVFSDYEIIPPFEQLGRPVYRLEPGEKRQTEITRLRGVELPAVSLVRTLDRLAWVRGIPEDVVLFEHSKPFYAAGVTAVIQYDGVPLGSMDDSDDQKIDHCFFLPGIYTPVRYFDHKKGMKLGEVDPVAFSEVVADLMVLVPLAAGVS
ncbi:MAG: DUF4132 domain-containing protein [bacterium]|nr:DUF4132 domain-containing protein [bacterium]